MSDKEETTLGEDIAEMVLETSTDLHNAGLMPDEEYYKIVQLTTKDAEFLEAQKWAKDE